MVALPGSVGRSLIALIGLLSLALPADAGDTFLYVQDREDGNGSVHAWRVPDDASGLEAVDGSPFAGPAVGGSCGGFCMSMATGQRGKQHYLFTAQDEGVLVWTILEGGVLELVPGSPFDAGEGAGNYTGIGTVRQGKRLFVYVSSFDADQVLGFEVQDDGTLVATPGSPYPAGGGPDGLDTAGRLVVACNESTGSLSSWVVQKDGELVEAPGSPLTVLGISAYNVQLDDKGRTVWFADSDADVFGFAADKKTGALTPLDGTPEDNALDEGDVGTEPGQRLLITFANSIGPNTPDIAVHAYSKQDGLTLLGRQISGLEGMDAHTFDERAGLLAVVRENPPAGASMRVFRVDRKTGAMLIVGGSDVAFDGVNDMQFVEL